MWQTIRRLARSIPGVPRAYFWLRPRAPGSIGLTTATEREYFARAAAEEYSGRGAVVDLGSWLGSTTAALAQGLLRNPRPQARSQIIHAYDLFVWDRAWKPYLPAEMHFAHGESFLPAFKANLRPWLNQVQIHTGDLTAARWDGPVELLLNDASKSWAIVEAVWRQFVVQLLVGGLLIEQDFKHALCPWLHVLQYRFREYFEKAEDVRDGATVAFRLKKAVPEAALTGAFGWDAYSNDECRAAFDWAAGLVAAHWRPAIYAAEAFSHVHQGDAPGARKVLERLRLAGMTHVEITSAETALSELTSTSGR